MFPISATFLDVIKAIVMIDEVVDALQGGIASSQSQGVELEVKILCIKFLVLFTIVPITQGLIGRKSAKIGLMSLENLAGSAFSATDLDLTADPDLLLEVVGVGLISGSSDNICGIVFSKSRHELCLPNGPVTFITGEFRDGLGGELALR